jgi:hypothetical protein
MTVRSGCSFSAEKLKAHKTPVLSRDETRYLRRLLPEYVKAKEGGNDQVSEFLFGVAMHLVLCVAREDKENWNGSIGQWRETVGMCHEEYLWLLGKRQQVSTA